jgi:hypothetical protein
MRIKTHSGIVNVTVGLHTFLGEGLVLIEGRKIRSIGASAA